MELYLDMLNKILEMIITDYFPLGLCHCDREIQKWIPASR